MKASLTVALVMLTATAAMAEPLTGRAAKKLLFPAKVAAQAEMLPSSGLSAEDQTILAAVASQQPYYGAIAISPEDGLLAESTIAAANHHDTAAAEVAALAQCEAKRTGAVPCVIAALIRPEGYEARDLSLSRDATAAVRADYPAKGGALAISAATGAWGLGKGADAALAACTAKAAEITDCAVVIAD